MLHAQTDLIYRLVYKEKETHMHIDFMC